MMNIGQRQGMCVLLQHTTLPIHSTMDKDGMVVGTHAIHLFSNMIERETINRDMQRVRCRCIEQNQQDKEKMQMKRSDGECRACECAKTLPQ